MKEVFNGGAFAQEFGIGSDAKGDVAAARVSGQSAAKFEAGARWHGAFLDDELGRLGLLGDLAGDMVDCGQVGFAIALRRSAYANEDGVAETNGLAGVGGVANVSACGGGGEDGVQVALVDGHLAVLELSDALSVDVRADDLMSGFSEASASDDAYISTADNGNAHGGPPGSADGRSGEELARSASEGLIVNPNA